MSEILQKNIPPGGYGNKKGKGGVLKVRLGGNLWIL
jgi:hypothetical protein